MRLDTRTAPGGEKVYLFSGILICGCCVACMTRKTVPYKGEKYHYYYCPTTKKRGCADGVNLKEALNTLKAEAAVLSASKSSDDELRRLAETALSADGLTRLLVDLLIDKVYVYPGNRIEIAWKVADFAKLNKEV